MKRRGVRPLMAVAIATLFTAFLIGLLVLDRIPALVLVAYGLLSLVGVATYRVDKFAAKRRAWRVSENTLHLIGLVGGWPGGLVARHLFRHKTTKQPFRQIFWVTVVANCAALAWIVYAAPLSSG